MNVYDWAIMRNEYTGKPSLVVGHTGDDPDTLLRWEVKRTTGQLACSTKNGKELSLVGESHGSTMMRGFP